MDMAASDRIRDLLIGEVYAAASGRLPWEQPLETLRQATGSWLTQLLAIDPRNRGVQFSHSSGESVAAHLDYVRTYNRIDPRVGIIIGRDDGANWAHCHELISEAQVAVDPFYQDFLIPYGGRYVTGTKLVAEPELMVILAVLRGVGQKPVEPEIVAWLDSVRSHFVEAIANYRHLAKLRLERAIGLALLDAIAHAVVLVDGSRAVHYANAAAREAMRRAECIVERNGLLGCRRADEDNELTWALQDLAHGPAGAEASRRRYVALRTAARPRTVTACLCRLLPQEVMGSFGSESLTMILFHDPEAVDTVDPFLVAEVLDLTPAEAQVAVALSQGVTVEEVARRRGVSVHTVRTQVKLSLAKTGAHSIADLVRRVLALRLVPG